MKRKATGNMKKGNIKKRKFFIPSQPISRRSEKKFIDDYIVSRALTSPTDSSGGELSTAVNGFLSGCNNGDLETNRDGNRIVLTSVEVKGVVTCENQTDQVALDAGTNVFLAIVWDKQTNGAQLNSEDVFSNPSANSVLAASPIRNRDFTKRFQVLKALEMTFQNPTVSYDGTNIEQSGLVKNFHMFRKVSIPVQYQGSTNTIANVTDNSLHVIGFCSNTALSPTVFFNSRVRFEDN